MEVIIVLVTENREGRSVKFAIVVMPALSKVPTCENQYFDIRMKKLHLLEIVIVRVIMVITREYYPVL